MPKLRMMTIAIPPTFGTSLSGLPIISRIADDYGKAGNENSHSDEGEGGKEYCVNAKTQYAILKQYL